MAAPLSPIEIEIKMAQCIEALEESTDDLKQFAHAAAGATHKYRQAFAENMLKAKAEASLTSDKMREAWAVRQTSDEMWERDCAEAAYEAQKSLFRSLQTQSELLRSLARSSRDLVDSWGTKP